MTDWIAATVLGIVEGLTEFIPVSSTGHLLIAEHWVPHQTDLFNIVIQSGAVLAAMPLFANRWRQALFGWGDPATREFLLKILAAFLVTCAGGFLIEKGGFKLPETTTPIAIALLVGGLLFLAVEKKLKGRPSTAELSWNLAVGIGLAQLVAAVFPGTSRSGATIVLALALGVNRVAATEFSFLVGIPTMLAAGSLKIFHAFHHASAAAPVENWGMVGLATVVSGLVSFVAVKWLLRFVQTHTFNGFGWYRIVLGTGLLLAAMMIPAMR